jgi:DnaJ-class molecular chaperone
MKNKKLILGGGFVGVILLGLVTNAIWDGLKPLTTYLFKITLNLSVLGIEKFKDNIYIEIDNEFNGYLEYERWVRCKKCDGHGKNFDKKIIIKNLEGKIIKIYQGGDGCDFCEGTGQNKDGDLCGVCGGHGKIGLSECVICHGNKRILGKQKLNNIKITGQKTKIDAMGHYSIDGKIGHLFLILKNK